MNKNGNYKTIIRYKLIIFIKIIHIKNFINNYLYKLMK